ncbi:MAG TPA: TAT-variant-translocated molybdopterin oxidoreductase, partial [Gemmataceae bacterium]|nr:TAT-variant-translocated molybdopterin oxidoreductase [Gemmataceae bacterium]
MPPLNPTNAPLDLEAVRQKLASSHGRTFWRGLEELAGTEAFREMVQREFPHQASEWSDPISRRRFLTLMAASLALAGLAGCNQKPAEKILPYVRQPEGLVPGRPLFFTTAMTLAGYATGLVVTSREGRPVKVEGNPDHPASRGATDAYTQASLLTLYDPDREQAVGYVGRIRTWGEALTALRARLKETKGEGVRVLTEATTSPTLTRLLSRLLKDFPRARWHQYDP